MFWVLFFIKKKGKFFCCIKTHPVLCKPGVSIKESRNENEITVILIYEVLL